jgi:hypothetical protein
MTTPILFKATPLELRWRLCEGERPPLSSAVKWEVMCEAKTVWVLEMVVNGCSKACWHTKEPPGTVDDIVEACRRRWPHLERCDSNTKPGGRLAP